MKSHFAVAENVRNVILDLAKFCPVSAGMGKDK
jgi:hypothetical protein